MQIKGKLEKHERSNLDRSYQAATKRLDLAAEASGLSKSFIGWAQDGERQESPGETFYPIAPAALLH